MRTRDLGRSGLELTELTLGTWGLSGDGYGPVPLAVQEAVIRRALNLGIRSFETATSYASGEMESTLGRLLQGTTDAKLISKLGADLAGELPKKNFDVEFLRTELDGSLKRLRRERLDVVLLHNPSEQAVKRDVLAQFANFIEESGKAEHWGVSSGSPEVISQALLAGASIVQLPYNAFYPRVFNEVSAQVHRDGAGLIVHSVLGYGLLAGNWGADQTFAPEDHRHERWNRTQFKRRLDQLDALDALHGEKITSHRAAALRYVLSNDLIGSAIVGPRTVIQLDQLVRDAGTAPPYLEDGALARFAQRFVEMGGQVH